MTKRGNSLAIEMSGKHYQISVKVPQRKLEAVLSAVFAAMDKCHATTSVDKKRKSTTRGVRGSRKNRERSRSGLVLAEKLGVPIDSLATNQARVVRDAVVCPKIYVKKEIKSPSTTLLLTPYKVPTTEVVSVSAASEQFHEICKRSSDSAISSRLDQSIITQEKIVDRNLEAIKRVKLQKKQNALANTLFDKEIATLENSKVKLLLPPKLILDEELAALTVEKRAFTKYDEYFHSQHVANVKTRHDIKQKEFGQKRQVLLEELKIQNHEIFDANNKIDLMISKIRLKQHQVLRVPYEEYQESKEKLEEMLKQRQFKDVGIIRRVQKQMRPIVRATRSENAPVSVPIVEEISDVETENSSNLYSDDFHGSMVYSKQGGTRWEPEFIHTG